MNQDCDQIAPTTLSRPTSAQPALYIRRTKYTKGRSCQITGRPMLSQRTRLRVRAVATSHLTPTLPSTHPSSLFNKACQIEKTVLLLFLLICWTDIKPVISIGTSGGNEYKATATTPPPALGHRYLRHLFPNFPTNTLRRYRICIFQ